MELVVNVLHLFQLITPVHHLLHLSPDILILIIQTGHLLISVMWLPGEIPWASYQTLKFAPLLNPTTIMWAVSAAQQDKSLTMKNWFVNPAHHKYLIRIYSNVWLQFLPIPTKQILTHLVWSTVVHLKLNGNNTMIITKQQEHKIAQQIHHSMMVLHALSALLQHISI